MSEKSKNTMSLSKFKDKNYGKRGSKSREKLESGYKDFKIGAMLLQARKERGLTQEELAQRVGMTKSYISKIENNIKEVRISTLKKIVELGLGGSLDLMIKIK